MQNIKQCAYTLIGKYLQIHLHTHFIGDLGRFTSGLGVDSGPIWGWNDIGEPAGDHSKTLEQHTPESVAKAKVCFFEVQGLAKKKGKCTVYGACRYQGQDYMYQVGLGEII